ncbi:MAG: TonB-dependent receptor, partial [Myxococcota bacterium]
LYGQAPYVANLSLRFDEPETGLGATVVYNVVGPRISDVGTRLDESTILPDIEEQPFHSLDLVASWAMTENFALRLKLRNLLLDTRDFLQGDFLTQRIEPGVSGSIGLTISH